MGARGDLHDGISNAENARTVRKETKLQRPALLPDVIYGSRARQRSMATLSGCNAIVMPERPTDA